MREPRWTLGSLPRVLVGLVSAGLVAGCGAGDGLDDGRLGGVAQDIAGGYDDTEDTSVVGITYVAAGLLCTGTLISPTVVLTARHCVSEVLNTTNGAVVCGQTSFGPLGPPLSFLVTTAPVVEPSTAAEYLVQEVVPLPVDDDLFCGNDVAILILNESVEASVTVPWEPRVDSALTPGEGYSAIGYGATDDSGAEAGIRRRRDDLAVDCVGDGCSDDQVTGTEWSGDTGICSGDSGGPAIDAQGRVVGVTSRGAAGCESPVYGSVHAWRRWLEDTAAYAAGLGEYAPPDWAAGANTDPAHSAPVGGDCAANEDCYSGHCLTDGSRPYCTRPCSADAPCPEDYACDGAAGVCRDPLVQPVPSYNRPDKDNECSVATVGHRSSPGPERGRWALLGLAGMWVLRRRRSWALGSR